VTQEQQSFLKSAEKVPAIFEFAKELVEIGYSVIQRLCEQSQPETLHIEFKQPNKKEPCSWSDRDAEYLGKSLSGYSNAEGGLLIWGIRTEKQSGVDVAAEITPISNLSTFHSKVRSLIGGYLSSQNDTVSTIAISKQGAVDCGIVVVCIPKGENRPYRANAPNTHNYYRKTSESILRMEHYEIADLFAATRSPALAVRKILRKNGYSDKSHQEFELSFWIINEGVIGAEQPFIWISHPPRVPISNVGPFNYPSTTHLDGQTKLYSPPSFTLFPDEEICTVRFKIYSLGNEFFVGSAPNQYDQEKRQRVGEMEICVRFGAKNAYRKDIVFPINDALLLEEKDAL
jgi:hypothetical protein